jgi:hypothetical protein
MKIWIFLKLCFGTMFLTVLGIAIFDVFPELKINAKAGFAYGFLGWLIIVIESYINHIRRD